MSPSVQFMVCNDHYKQNTALFLWNTYEKINPFLGLFFIFYNTWLSTMSPSVQNFYGVHDNDHYKQNTAHKKWVFTICTWSGESQSSA